MSVAHSGLSDQPSLNVVAHTVAWALVQLVQKDIGKATDLPESVEEILTWYLRRTREVTYAPGC